MPKFLSRFNRQQGFTLVELMIVVAIIGLLSAVVIPNFKKYQAKAKIAEAKLSLTAAYVAQASFFADYNLYSNCLSYMGFDPSLQINSRYYAIGFTSSSDVNPPPDHIGWISAMNSGLASCLPGQAGAVVGQSFFPAGKGSGAAVMNSASLADAASAGTFAESILLSQDDDSTMGFIISASGFISSGDGAATSASVLAIDESKTITMERTGY